MTIVFIVLLVYASYLSLEKYITTGHLFRVRRSSEIHRLKESDNIRQEPEVEILASDVIGKSSYHVGQVVTNADNKRQVAPKAKQERIFTMQRQPTNPPPDFPNSIIRDDGLTEIRALPFSADASHYDLEDIPERDDVFGYAPKGHTSRTTGVTLDELDAVRQVIETDDADIKTKDRARSALHRLKDTDVERIMRASILGSSEKLKRYMDLYITQPPVRPLSKKTKETILGMFDIEEFV